MKTQIYPYLGRLTLIVSFLIAGLALSSPGFAQEMDVPITPDGAATTIDRDPKECFASDGTRLPFALARSNLKGTEAFAFHPLDVRFENVRDVALDFKTWGDCRDAERNLKDMIEKFGEGGPEYEKAKEALCSTDVKKGIIQNFKVFLTTFSPRLQRYTAAMGQHDANEWPDSFPVFLATLNDKEIDLTFVLEERLYKFGHDYFNYMMEDALNKLAGQPRPTEPKIGPARVAIYSGTQFLQEIELPKEVIDPTSIFAFKSAKDDPKLVVLDKAGGSISDMPRYEANFDEQEGPFVSGRFHVFALETAEDGTRSLSLEKTGDTGGFHPNNFFFHENRMIFVNQGGIDIPEPEGVAYGSVTICNDVGDSCKTDTLRSSDLVKKGWFHGNPWHSAILEESLFFTQVNIPNVIAEAKFPSKLACQQSLKEWDEKTDDDIEYDTIADVLCSGPAKVKIEDLNVKFKAGSQVEDFVAVSVAQSPLLPKAQGPFLKINVDNGRIVVAPTDHKVAVFIAFTENLSGVFHLDLTPGSVAGEYSINHVVGQLLGPVNSWAEGEFLPDGGFSIKLESLNSSAVGQYNFNTGEVAYHYIKRDVVPVDRIADNFYEYKHSKVGTELRFGLGHLWSAIEQIVIKGEEGQPDTPALLLGSQTSLDAMAITKGPDGKPKLIGVWRAATDSYEAQLVSLIDRQSIIDGIDSFINKTDITVEQLTDVAVGTVNSITSLFAGLTDLHFVYEGKDFDLVARLGLPIDLVSQLRPTPRFGAKGKAMKRSLHYDESAPSLLRFVKLYLAIREAIAAEEIVEEEKKSEKGWLEHLDDDDIVTLLDKGIPRLRTPSQVTCSKVGPVPADDEIFGEQPPLPNLPGVDGYVIEPTIGILRLPLSCKFADFITGEVRIANDQQNTELWEWCRQEVPVTEPKGKALEASKMVADYLWKHPGGRLEEPARLEVTEKIAALVGEKPIIKRIQDNLLESPVEEAAPEIELLKPLDSAWIKKWERATCGETSGCYANQVLAAQGVDLTETIPLVQNGGALISVASVSGGACSLSFVAPAKSTRLLPLILMGLVLPVILISVRRIAVRVKKR